MATEDDDLERRLRDVLHSRGLGAPVPPDAIDRIHAGARRRQRRRSTVAALGAVAVIGVVAGTIGLNVGSGHGSNVAAKLNPASSSTFAAQTATPLPRIIPVTESPGVASSPAVAGSSPALAVSPPVASVFNPVSVSAVGVNDYWVLGYMSTKTSDGYSVSTAIMQTTDGGQHFQADATPDATVGEAPTSRPSGATTVSEIRFGDTNNGWAYGDSLFETTDGGGSWLAVTGVPGDVVDLAAASGNVWAVADDESSGSPSYSLFHATYGTSGTSAWTKVGLNTTSFTNVVVIKKNAYLLAATAPTQPGIFVTITNGGANVSSTSGPCGVQATGVLSVAGDGSLWALCTSGHTTTEFVSTDAGAHWSAAHFPLVTYSIGGVDSTHAVVYDDTELDLITLTSSSPVAVAPGSAATPGVSFIGFTTTKIGFLVATMQNATPSQLWRTTDGGSTWSVVQF